MSELENFGNLLVDTANQYTHPSYSDMYPDWSTVSTIGEELIKMTNPQLNDNQKIVLEWLKTEHFDSYSKAVISNMYFYINLTDVGALENKAVFEMVESYYKLTQLEFVQVLKYFSEWALSKEVAE